MRAVKPLIDQEAEELQRGGVDPVQVLHHQEHGLLGRNAQQDGQQGMQRLLLLLLGERGSRGHSRPAGRESRAARRGTACEW